jgi:hypothetical protein
MDVTVYGMPLKVLSTQDVLIPVITPGSDASVMVSFNTLETGDIQMDVSLEREVSGSYTPVFAWPDINISLTPGNTFYGGSDHFERTIVNTGLWRWRIVYIDELFVTREVFSYFQVQDAIKIPSTTMVKSSIGGCSASPSGAPKLYVIQDNDLDVDAFLYDNQGDSFIGLSTATDAEVRLISVDTRLTAGTIEFADITFDAPELGDGSVQFTIPSALTNTLAPGMYRVYLQVIWADRILEWPKIFDLNVMKQRV